MSIGNGSREINQRARDSHAAAQSSNTPQTRDRRRRHRLGHRHRPRTRQFRKNGPQGSQRFRARCRHTNDHDNHRRPLHACRAAKRAEIHGWGAGSSCCCRSPAERRVLRLNLLALELHRQHPHLSSRHMDAETFPKRRQATDRLRQLRTLGRRRVAVAARCAQGRFACLGDP